MTLKPLPLLTMLLFGCGAVFHLPQSAAAGDDILAAASACAEPDWRDKAGRERAETWREAVNCFKDLYIRVAAGKQPDEELRRELAMRLDKLEAAYHGSRDICGLRQRLQLDDGGCGTISLSPGEFIILLKTMILNEDAGWVRPNPALAEALRLNE